jgi:predicted nucleic acid-binding Zn ribbon protein
MRYDAKCSNCGTIEIIKPMAAAWPTQHDCGGALTRLYGATAVIFAAPGFVTSDTRFERQLSPERAARFRAQRADAERRSAAGRLTPYEQGLERD